jgi:hypothetical protein
MNIIFSGSDPVEAGTHQLFRGDQTSGDHLGRFRQRKLVQGSCNS